MISVDAVTVEFNGSALFSDITFNINENDRIALMNPYAATVMCAAYLSLVMVHGVAMVRFWPSLG